MKKELNVRRIVSSILLSSMLMGITPIKSYATHPPIPQRNVIRIAGKDRFETAEKIAEKVIELGGNSEEYALANGLNFPDALSLSPFCIKNDIPLLLYDTINKNKSQYAKIFYDKTFNAAQGKYITSTYVAGMNNPPFQTNKNMSFRRFKSWGGAESQNRFETNRNIAYDISNNPKTVIVANGHKFADALAGASLSGVLGGVPIILTDSDRIHPMVGKYLSNPSIETVYILEGESAVSSLVEREISGKDVDESVAKYMPKWSIAVHNIVYPITNVVANSQLDFSNVQFELDVARFTKTWINQGALFNEYKVHGDGKSIALAAHATDYGWFIETAQFIYLSDKNGNVKKYVRTHEITKVYTKAKYVDKDEWSIRKGTYRDCVTCSTCTGEYLNGNPENPIYKIHIFEPVK